MIIVYHRVDGRIVVSCISEDAELPEDFIWIDVHAMSVEEEKSLERQLNIEIPNRDEIWKNRVLNRFYEENGVYYMSAAIITKVGSPYPQTSNVSFVLAKDYLITLRTIIPTSFQNFSHRLVQAPQKFPTSARILEGLLNEMITRVVYNSDIVVQDLDRLTHDVFNVSTLAKDAQGHSASDSMKDILRTLGTCADLNSQINESLHSMLRLLTYFQQTHAEDKELVNNIQILMADAKSLSQQGSFLADKITFLLDATLGMINVEQNFIIKIFSVVTVFFVPATLISSIYGMNFHHMPELNWLYGYPFALGLIAICAIVPFVYFRKKGWL